MLYISLQTLTGQLEVRAVRVGLHGRRPVIVLASQVISLATNFRREKVWIYLVPETKLAHLLRASKLL
jgi:hypothetical protein